ncbi:unnamed protein product, partial [Prorocentrum cordatum]
LKPMALLPDAPFAPIADELLAEEAAAEPPEPSCPPAAELLQPTAGAPAVAGGAGGGGVNHKGQLSELAARLLGRPPTSDEIEYVTAPAAPFVCTVTLRFFPEAPPFTGEACPEKCLAEQSAAQAAVLAGPWLAPARLSAPPAPPRAEAAATAAEEGGAPGPPAAPRPKDYKGLLATNMQLRLGRPVTKHDVAYVSNFLPPFQCTLTLPGLGLAGLEQPPPCTGSPHPKKVAAEQSAAQRMLELMLQPPASSDGGAAATAKRGPQEEQLEQPPPLTGASPPVSPGPLSACQLVQPPPPQRPQSPPPHCATSVANAGPREGAGELVDGRSARVEPAAPLQKDYKGLLNTNLQFRLGRPVTKHDVAYVSSVPPPFQCTVTLPGLGLAGLEQPPPCTGSPRPKKVAAEQSAAQRMLELLLQPRAGSDGVAATAASQREDPPGAARFWAQLGPKQRPPPPVRGPPPAAVASPAGGPAPSSASLSQEAALELSCPLAAEQAQPTAGAPAAVGRADCKSQLNVFASRTLRRPLASGDVDPSYVTAPAAPFVCTVTLTFLLDAPSFTGEACSKKSLAEQSAAQAAMQGLAGSGRAAAQLATTPAPPLAAAGAAAAEEGGAARPPATPRPMDYKGLLATNVQLRLGRSVRKDDIAYASSFNGSFQCTVTLPGLGLAGLEQPPPCTGAPCQKKAAAAQSAAQRMLELLLKPPAGSDCALAAAAEREPPLDPRLHAAGLVQPLADSDGAAAAAEREKPAGPEPPASPDAAGSTEYAS